MAGSVKSIAKPQAKRQSRNRRPPSSQSRPNTPMSSATSGSRDRSRDASAAGRFGQRLRQHRRFVRRSRRRCWRPMRRRRRGSRAWQSAIGRRRQMSTYIAPGDTSQNQHIEGLPFGTRGGMSVRHNFPGRWRVQVLDPELRDRSALFAASKSKLTIDGERVHLFDYNGVRTVDSGNVRRERWRLEVTVPVKAGTHGSARLSWRRTTGPASIMVKQYDTKVARK